VSVLNFTSVSLKILNPHFLGKLHGDPPPGYDPYLDNLAIEALSTALAQSTIDLGADGSFALQWVASMDDEREYRFVLYRTSSPKARNGALFNAVRHGRIEYVRILMEDGVHPGNNADLPLKTAAAVGDVEIVKMLLATGKVDPAAANNTPLFEAADKGHV